MAQFLRFLVVGSINSLFGYAVFASLIFFGLHFALALLFATVIGVLFNFVTTGRLVFGSSNYVLIFRFIGTYGVIYLIHVACLQLLSLTGISIYIAGMVLLLPMAILGFYLNKRFVFVK